MWLHLNIKKSIKADECGLSGTALSRIDCRSLAFSPECPDIAF